MMNPLLPNLFRPLQIKGLVLKNRIIMAPMGVRLGSFGYRVTDRLRRYYVERARGGAALLLVQVTSVSLEGVHVQYTPGMWSDEFVPGFAALAADVHAAGGRIGVQLGHAGNHSRSAFTGMRPVAPSAIPARNGEMPRALFAAEIEGLIEGFATATRRVRDAGFDLVEFHAAHGYLLHQFLSPLWNQRDDQYGGNLENRARVLLEIVRSARDVVGKDFPISVRLTGDEYSPYGTSIADACKVARWLEAAGVDLLSVSGGGGADPYTVPCGLIPAGSLVHLAAAVRQAVKLPVVAVGRLHEPAQAEATLAEGKADLIALARALLADPYWPTKAAEGRWDEIRPCVACSAPDCSLRTGRQLDVACKVNPILGREGIFEPERAERPKRVMVIGGGPAGMEAAMAASSRGHLVTLYERESELGGQLPLAATPPHKEEMGRYLRYARRAVASSAVRVETGVEVDGELVQRERPDMVILATGANPTVPSMPIRDTPVATSWDVLAGKTEAIGNVVVVGGGYVGCEVAQFLVARGSRVTILEMLPEVARELVPINRELLLRELANSDVEILTNAKVVSIDRGSVAYDRAGVNYTVVNVDMVVFATGVKPMDLLAGRLSKLGYDIRVVGDCAKPGNLGSAVRGGFEAGISVE